MLFQCFSIPCVLKIIRTKQSLRCQRSKLFYFITERKLKNHTRPVSLAKPTSALQSINNKHEKNVPRWLRQTPDINWDFDHSQALPSLESSNNKSTTDYNIFGREELTWFTYSTKKKYCLTAKDNSFDHLKFHSMWSAQTKRYNNNYPKNRERSPILIKPR